MLVLLTQWLVYQMDIYAKLVGGQVVTHTLMAMWKFYCVQLYNLFFSDYPKV